MSPTKARCPVCGDSFLIKKRYLSEHNLKSTIQKVCYGSYLPLFLDNKNNFQLGIIMFTTQKKSDWH